MKAFHIAFTFDQPTPHVMTIVADNSTQASAKLMDMLKDFRNVSIHEIVDVEDIPIIKEMLAAQAKLAEMDDDTTAQQTAEIIEFPSSGDTKTNTVN